MRVSPSGGLSDFGGVYAHRPELWTAFQFQYGVMCERSLLDVKTRELLRLKSAFINGCNSCQLARSTEARDDDLDEATVAKIHQFRDSDLPEEIKVALEFAERWYLDHAQTIDDELFERLRRSYTEAQIVELAVAVGAWEGVHKLKQVFQIEPSSPDLRFRPDGRVPEAMRVHLDGLESEPVEALAH